MTTLTHAYAMRDLMVQLLTDETDPAQRALFEEVYERWSRWIKVYHLSHPTTPRGFGAWRRSIARWLRKIQPTFMPARAQKDGPTS